MILFSTSNHNLTRKANMHSSLLSSFLAAGLVLAVPTPRDDTDANMTQFYELLAEASANQAAFLATNSSSNCTSETMVVRKPW